MDCIFFELPVIQGKLGTPHALYSDATFCRGGSHGGPIYATHSHDDSCDIYAGHCGSADDGGLWERRRALESLRRLGRLRHVRRAGRRVQLRRGRLQLRGVFGRIFFKPGDDSPPRTGQYGALRERAGGRRVDVQAAPQAGREAGVMEPHGLCPWGGIPSEPAPPRRSGANRGTGPILRAR